MPYNTNLAKTTFKTLLQEDADLYDFIDQHGNSGIWLWIDQSKPSFWFSHLFVHGLGFGSPEDFAGILLDDILIERTLEDFLDEIRHLTEKPSRVSRPVSFMHQDKRKIMLLASVRHYDKDGQLINIIAFKPYHYLKDPESEFFKSVVQSQNELVCRYTPDLRITFVNNAYAAAFGKDVHELIGKKITDFVPTDQHENLKSIVEQYKVSKEGAQNIQKVVAQNANFRWYEWTDYLIFDDEGNLKEIQAIGNDITTHKKILITSEKNKKRFKNLVDSVPVGVFEFGISKDGKLQFYYISPKWCEMNAVTEEMLRDKKMTIMEHVHPEDFQSFDAKLAEAIKHDADFEWSGRFIIKDRVKYMRITSRVRKLKRGLKKWNGIQEDITEQEENKLKAAKQSELIQKLSDMVPGSLFQFQRNSDGSYHFPFFSKGFEQLFGVPSASQEKDDRSIFQHIHRDDMESLYQSIGYSERTGELWRQEFRVLMPDKMVKWIRGTAKPEHKGNKIIWHGYLQDITKDKMSEIKLREMALIAAKTRNSVLLTDKNLMISWVNHSCLELSGYPLEEIRGKNYLEMIVPDSLGLESRNQIKSQVQQGEQFEAKIQIKKKDGSGYWVEVMFTPMYDDGGNLYNYLIVEHNITEMLSQQKKLEETLIVSMKQNERLTNFSHIVSHDIRSHSANLTSIVKYLADIDMPTNAIYDEGFQMLQHSTKKLGETIAHLSQIIDIQQNELLEKISCNLYEQIEATIETLRISIHDMGAIINNNIPKDANINIVPAYLESITLNLISNAIKYKHPDRNPVINIRFYQNENFHVMEIEDNGLGIDLESHGHKIFGMYKTFHGNEDARGIGLFTVKNQIESMRGKIEVESSNGVGSKFIVYFRKMD